MLTLPKHDPAEIVLSPERLPLLITGATGVAGYNAFAYFRARYGDQVIGQRPRVTWRMRGPGIEAADLENPVDVQQLFARYPFKSVLSCGGSCALKSCELDPAMAQRVNVLAVQNLLQAIGQHDIRLVHLSIDLVFSGTRAGDYLETDSPDPVTVYGATMVTGERLVSAARPDACILRISLPMGESFNGHAGAIDWIQSRFRKGFPATLYFDEVRTPSYVQCMNELYERVLGGRWSGLFHAGGPRKLTLFEIAQIVNRVGGYDPQLLRGCPRIQAGAIPPRAGNVTLSSAKLCEALGYPPFLQWPRCDSWVPDHRRWHFERSPDREYSPQMISEILYRR